MKTLLIDFVLVCALSGCGSSCRPPRAAQDASASDIASQDSPPLDAMSENDAGVADTDE